MARLPRIWAPGVPEHLIVRGNDRQAIFRSDGDRIFFHRCLWAQSKRLGVAVHAYVFMTNHVHLLATGGQAGATSDLFQSLGRRYVGYFNYLHGRTGTLWEGRFRACPVQTDRYFLACQRYIERNPVRAGIVRRPWDFPWSSCRYHAGAASDDLLTPHPVYLGLADDPADRQALYVEFCQQHDRPQDLAAIRDALNKRWALGDEEFGARIEAATGRRSMPKRPGRPRSTVSKVELIELESDPNYGQGTARSWEPA